MRLEAAAASIPLALALSVVHPAGAEAQMGRADPTPEQPRRVIIDVDPGIDDAMAMLLAMNSPELTIEAFTVVSGNVFVEQGVENALKLVELANRRDIRVAKGARYPLRRKLITAEAVHGPDGLGGKALPAPSIEADPARPSS